ncbi:MAG: aminoacyl-tRNA hydrolase [Chloroflexi bacterium]|nr:aminoacyl-tRNA hydrolase [Chloroflexota bacterium]
MVVGIGNPGAKFESNRHNIGFRVLDEMARRLHVRFEQRKFNGRFVATRRADGDPLYLLKPQTYVNDSGRSVGPAAHFYRLPVERVLVICDDIDLPFARIRVRAGGSSGGHNGLKSIIDALGNRQDFPRIRIGVGRPPHVREVVIDHVLEDFSKEQEEQLPALIGDVADAADLVMDGELNEAMSRYNAGRVA